MGVPSDTKSGSTPSPGAKLQQILPFEVGGLIVPVEAVTYACKSPVLNKSSGGVDAEKCDTAADTI